MRQIVGIKTNKAMAMSTTVVTKIQSDTNPAANTKCGFTAKRIQLAQVSANIENQNVPYPP